MSFGTNIHTQVLTDGLHCLPQIDLTNIRGKVAREHSELTAEQLDELEFRYLRFLMLCKVEPKVKHQPDEDVDHYWHAHILHTKQYAKDCQLYFGYFLHHDPNATSSGQACNSDNGCGGAISS